nr:ribonuclease H-like domain-containing protein [Tanacetum cinerariifolium]
MVTRAKAGIFKLLVCMHCHVTTTSPLRRSHVHALRDPNYKEAMLDEYNALITNETWVLVPRQANVIVFRSIIFFSIFLRIIASLYNEFALTDLGSLNYFLESKLGLDGDPVSNPTLYYSLADDLQYLTFTRPELSYAVQHVFLYMHDPRDPYFTALNRILCYIRGTLDYEAEYRGVANVVTETAWLRNLLCELHTPLFTATLVYCDNISTFYMSANMVQHQCTKHKEIDIHFVRDFVASGQVRLLHVSSKFQYANTFTKGLPAALFIEFHSSLNVRRSPTHTEGEY